jgi:hypothetical protein
VPENDRIIELRGNQVNGFARIPLIVCVVFLMALMFSCGKESRAQRVYHQAQEHVQAGELDDAVLLLDRIVADYPTTETARKARKEVLLYRGLTAAEIMYPYRRAEERVIRTARALQRYRDRRRAWPEHLSALVPDYLDRVPWDPWGRELLYRAKPSGRGYVLACYGADGEPGGEGDDRDWLVENGSFVRALSRSPE